MNSEAGNSAAMSGVTPQLPEPQPHRCSCANSGAGSNPEQGAPGKQPALTIERYAQKLVGETPLTMSEFARAAGATREQAEEFWRGIGQVVSHTETPQFGLQDVHALRTYRSLISTGKVDAETARTLLRASQTTDRLALWQVEAYVDDVIRREGLDDTTARIVALDRLEDFLAAFEEQLVYTWRRQMLALLTRMDADYAQAGLAEADEMSYPLQRTLGFVDMAGFSRHSARIGSAALAELISKFEGVVRDVISELGGRVVKTIGDAVLFIADDLQTGTEVAVTLAERLAATPNLLPVRASVVEGGVVSRFGDVFGPTVNLASRLVNESQPGQLLTDSGTAAAIATKCAPGSYRLDQIGEVDLRGIGPTVLVDLKRG
ncbi:adenylate/guanylate cyclase domain-containing protein [Buchananella felis]|uniref:adenylate/guanylate cyclase domain-containing protein n=1 Tax=Buchananella felis TaxID=3231492 RepID=UPI003528B79F